MIHCYLQKCYRVSSKQRVQSSSCVVQGEHLHPPPPLMVHRVVIVQLLPPSLLVQAMHSADLHPLVREPLALVPQPQYLRPLHRVQLQPVPLHPAIIQPLALVPYHVQAVHATHLLAVGHQAVTIMLLVPHVSDSECERG